MIAFSAFLALESSEAVSVIGFLFAGLLLCMLGFYNLAPTELGMWGASAKLHQIEDRLELLGRATLEETGEAVIPSEHGDDDNDTVWQQLRVLENERMREAREYEEDLGRVLASYCQEQGWTYFGRSYGGRERFDYLIQAGDSRLAIEAKYRAADERAAYGNWIRRLARQAGTRDGVDRLLVVTNKQLGPGGERVVSEVPHLDAAVYRGEDDDRDLRQKLRELLAV